MEEVILEYHNSKKFNFRSGSFYDKFDIDFEKLFKKDKYFFLDFVRNDFVVTLPSSVKNKEKILDFIKKNKNLFNLNEIEKIFGCDGDEVLLITDDYIQSDLVMFIFDEFKEIFPEIIKKIKDKIENVLDESDDSDDLKDFEEALMCV